MWHPVLCVKQDAARNQRLSSDTYQRLASYVALGCGGAAVYSAVALGSLGLAWHTPAAAKRCSSAPFAAAAARNCSGLAHRLRSWHYLRVCGDVQGCIVVVRGN